LVLLVAASLFGAYTGLAWAARGANDLLAQYYGTSTRPHAPQAPAPSTVYAQSLKELPDYKPEKVWLVEGGEGFERYSNGARVLTDLETTNHRRGFYAYARGESKAPGGLKREPVGIVYHTSESDMLPFTPDNNASIEMRSRGLLEYVRRHKSYNYVIDRFGQIYKIVRDEDAANHSGNSVWSDDRATFVGLNESFLGVCFETAMSAGAEERLTEAQLVAGRLLTQVLRSRHQIEDAYCVTHGLVSVNPSNMRILFHHDWARGFPFEAFGLSDKYAVAPASVAEFGFTYDEEDVGKLGGALWPGVAKAEEEFGKAAERAGAQPEEFRRRMRESYRERMELQRRARVAEAGQPEAVDAAGDED
ncbi:MAG TPA: peptidoglycan recognition family protein, partial [Pyrinomonadaceae bacterium]|nr:peptidoglycan recognition family protein [Pyrinomonadaceae bacterium]